MPIRAEFRKFYGRGWSQVVRPRILKRAGNKCEQCGAPNNTELTRVAGWWQEWSVSWKLGAVNGWRDACGAIRRDRDLPAEPPARHVRIVLTIAHRNHTPGDDRDENLMALCQWCHLNYDKLHHAETRATRKDAARPLLAEVAP